MATTKNSGAKTRSDDDSSTRITPEQALENTRALLQEKQDKDEQPKAWQQAGATPQEGTVGYQSDGAADRAEKLHEGEVRLQANGGSISTHDRKNQAKRDKRS